MKQYVASERGAGQNTESLDAHLDRLNSALESMIDPAQRYDPKIDCITSPDCWRSCDDEQSETASKFTFEDEDPFFCRLDTLASRLEQARMVTEDFRSFELRASPMLWIGCSLAELKTLLNELSFAVEARSQLPIKVGSSDVYIALTAESTGSPAFDAMAKTCQSLAEEAENLRMFGQQFAHKQENFQQKLQELVKLDLVQGPALFTSKHTRRHSHPSLGKKIGESLPGTQVQTFIKQLKAFVNDLRRSHVFAGAQHHEFIERRLLAVYRAEQQLKAQQKEFRKQQRDFNDLKRKFNSLLEVCELTI